MRLSPNALAASALTLLVALAGVPPVLAQAPASFRHIGKDEGLSQNSVFAIAQDEAGFLWFGTRDGLNRFDGHGFRHFRQDTTDGGPLGNDVRALAYEAADQSLWVGSTDGLSRYCSRRDRFSFYPQVAGAVRELYLAPGGGLWIGTSLGLYHRPAGAKAPILVEAPGADLSAVNAVLAHGRTVYVGTDGGLLRLRQHAGGGFVADPLDLPEAAAAQHTIKALHRTPEGVLYFGTYADGLYRYDERDGTLGHYRHDGAEAASLPDDNVRALRPDGRGGLWVGTFRGLGLLDMATGEFAVMRAGDARSDELSGNSIRALYVDARGSLWAGTYHGGVNQLDPGNDRFETYVRTPTPNTARPGARDRSIGADIISSFAEDAAGNLYVGTEGGGLDYLHVGSGEFEHLRHDPANPNSVAGSNVKSLLLDGDQLWVGTFSRGLSRMSTATRAFEHYTAPADETAPRSGQLSNGNVYSLAKYGGRIWAGTYGGGVNVLDVAADTFAKFRHEDADPNSLPSDFVRVLHVLPGELLVGSDAGLHRVSLGADGLPSGYEPLLEGVRVHAVHRDTTGRLWAGTLSNGAYAIDEAAGTTTHYTVDEGLPGNSVFGILGDARGRLWMSTNDGLALLHPDSDVITTFSHPSGLLDGEFNFGAYRELADGDLVFGGLYGFVRFDPATVAEETTHPPIAFTELTHRGRVVRPGEGALLRRDLNHADRITLAYNDASFAVGLAALDYVTPDGNRLEYKLEGLDPDWNVARGHAQAVYTIQRHGDYTLRVRSVNSAGVPNPIERRMEFKVLPPPWRTTGAYVAYGLLLLAGAFGIYRFTHLRHRYQLEHLARLRDEELHEGKLRFFTNITHEFRTPLTLIVGPVEDLLADASLPAAARRKLERVAKNSHRLLDLVDRVLTFRKLSTEHGRLQRRHLELNWFLRKLNEPFADEALRRGIDMRIDMPLEDLDVYVDGRMLEMAVTALLSNAMKFTPDGGRISLSAKRLPGDEFEIRIVDDGRGVPDSLKAQIFERYFEDPTASRGVGSGIGLSVAKDLVALHSGRITVEDTPGGGATFVMTLPVGADDFSSAGADDGLRELAVTTDKGVAASAAAAAVSDGSARPIGASPPAPAPSATPAPSVDKRYRLLIVEDNAELRDYLATIFADDYDVLLAADGARGLEVAQSDTPPDLVLSDVMMPVMDGQEMCRRLKSDLRTSHIPVLLLTAKTSALARLDGLRLGADDYIAKPFLPEELTLRVGNTLATRARIRESFSRVIQLEPKEISVTSADEEFLVAAMAFVEDGIDDVDLDVRRMTQALNVSRALLFTKVKALTGQTPSNFVKTIRLKRAAQLLATGKLNVSEVAYRVGFRDPKYFNKCFKKVYGVSASGYAAQQVG